MEKINLLTEVSVTKNEAQASIENPTLTKMSFVFTDNLPNGNRKGVPVSAFPSIIKTGIFMPVKVAEGAINIDHSGAFPIGVISSLKENQLSDTVDQIVGEAVLWNSERPEDTDLIKSAFASGEKLNISWEILYSESSKDDNGIEWYLDPIVKAATFVGLPAYGGRTPVTAVASQDLPNENYLYIEPSEDGNGKKYFPYINLDGSVNGEWAQQALNEIPGSGLSEDVKQDLVLKLNSILEPKQGNATMEKEELEAKVAELEAKIVELEGKEVERQTELSSLREFKADVERKEAEATLLKARLDAFASAGVEVHPEDIEAKKSYWLKMDEEQFNFLVAELKPRQQDNSSLHTDKVPDRLSPAKGENPIDIVRAALKELK